MIKKQEYKGLTWIDIESPGAKDIDAVSREYSLPTEAAENLLSPTPKHRVIEYQNCIYIVLHFPTLSFHKNAFRGENHRKEIDFILGQNFLITVHYDSMTSIDKFSKALKKNGVSEGDEENAGIFFHRLIKNLYHYLLHDVEAIKDSLHLAEAAVFQGQEKKMVIELSNIHRDILRFNNALAPHKNTIESLRPTLSKYLGDKSEMLIHDIKSEYDRVDRRMAANKALLDELRHTNDSLLSAKQNEAIKGLTMMAFITFPLTLIAAIFAMDTRSKPIVGQPNDFFIIIGMMVLVVVFCLGFFKYRKWL